MYSQCPHFSKTNAANTCFCNGFNNFRKTHQIRLYSLLHMQKVIASLLTCCNQISVRAKSAVALYSCYFVLQKNTHHYFQEISHHLSVTSCGYTYAMIGTHCDQQQKNNQIKLYLFFGSGSSHFTYLLGQFLQHPTIRWVWFSVVILALRCR
jgi:hypothetical protein